MTAEKKMPPAPPGLDAPGRKLWRDVIAELDEISASHLAVLETAARNLDRLRAAEAVLAVEGLTVPGRFSTQTHPLVLVARDAGAAMRSALKQIEAELDDDAKVSRPGPRPQTKIKAQKKAIAERRAAQWGSAG